MNKKLLVILLLSLFLLTFVSADTKMPGTKNLDYTVKIKNFDDFQNYTLFLNNVGLMGRGMQIFESSEMKPSGYKFSSNEFCVLKEKDFNPETLNRSNLWHSLSQEEQQEIIDSFYWTTGDGERVQMNISYEDEWELTAEVIYLKSPEVKNKLTCFEETISHYGLSSKASIFKGFTTILTIQEENGAFLLTKKTRRTYTPLPLLLVLFVFLIEWVIIEAILRKEEKGKRIWVPILIINLITVLSINLISSNFYVIFLLEILIMFIEAIALKFLLKIKFSRALICSVIANFVTGILSLIFLLID
jgi:hypothetical protein